MSTLSVATIKSLTTNAPVFQNSSGTEKGQLCKAWVSFQGNASGSTKPINADFNVSTVDDIAVGRYAINFTNAMADSNYCFAGNCGNDDSTMTTMTGIQLDGTKSTTQ